jgi:membrane fusion protein (multidrug efflux system)
MKRFLPNPPCAFSAALVVVLASALCFTGCGPKPESSKADSSHRPILPTAPVRIQTIQSKPQAITEEVVGTVRAKLHATLEAKVSGRIDRLPVVLGQRVKAGELVARLDAGEINARLEQAAASLEQAERDWKRISTLFAQQAVTRSDYEASEARHRVAKGAAAEAKAMMSYVEIVAPFDGVVTKKWTDVGDLAAPGKPIISLEDPAALQLEADLPQAIAAQVQRAARHTARVDGMSGAVTGTVSEIAPTTDPVSRTIRVKVDLSAQPGLSSGQFARLVVPVGEGNSLRVPLAAVVQRGQLEIVFVVAQQRARLQLVRTGKRIGDEVEILSGLQAGAAVVIEGADQLTDGQPVETK